MAEKKSPMIGVVGSENMEKGVEIQKDTTEAPSLMVMDLQSHDGRVTTDVERTHLVQISVMTAESVEAPDFVAIVMGVPGDRAFFCPMLPERAESFADGLRNAACELRKQRGETVN